MDVLKAKLEKDRHSQQVPKPFSVLLLADKVISSKNTSGSIASRVKEACDAYNNKVAASKKIVLTEFLEYVVLMNVSVNYNDILKETDTPEEG